MGRRGRLRGRDKRNHWTLIWTIVGALAGVAGVMVAIVLAVAAKGDDSPGQGSSAPGETLEVVDAVVSNKRPHIGSPTQGDLGQTPGGEYDARQAAGIVLTLRNAGSEVAVINRVRFTVSRYDELSADGCIPGAGPVAISANYNVKLPPHGHVGQVIETNVSQEVLPQRADRMRLGLALDNPKLMEVYDNGDGTGASRLYALRVDLFHDGEKKPVSAGTVLVALPFPYYGLFVRSDLGPPGDCIPHNVAALKRMVTSNAKRSPELDAFAADPKAAACKIDSAQPYCATAQP